MQTSKDLFMMMRESEVNTHRFLPSKKELKKSTLDFAKNLVDSGENNITEIFTQAVRMKEAITVIEDFLRREMLQESFEAFGVKGDYRNGGNTTNFKDDETFKNLMVLVEHRKGLITLANKSDIDIYDEEGNKVEKVSTTPRKSALAISY